MTTPPPDPPGGYLPPAGQQPGYPPPAGQQPGGYPPPASQQPGGYPPPGSYPGAGHMPAPPPGYGMAPAGAARPGTLTGAAVLAFVVGGLAIIGLLGILALTSGLGVAGWVTFTAVLALLVAIGLIWGGVQALGGKDTRILVIAAAILIVVQILNMVAYFQAASLVGLVIAVLIIALALQPTSKAWVKAKGGKTF